MTNKEFFTQAIALNVSKEFTEKAQALLATLEKKSASKAKAQTENAKANLAIAQEFAKVCKPNVTYAVSEIKALTKSELSTAKISAVLRVAEENGLVKSCTGYKVGGKGRAVKGYVFGATETEGETEGE